MLPTLRPTLSIVASAVKQRTSVRSRITAPGAALAPTRALCVWENEGGRTAKPAR